LKTLDTWKMIFRHFYILCSCQTASRRFLLQISLFHSFIVASRVVECVLVPLFKVLDLSQGFCCYHLGDEMLSFNVHIFSVELSSLVGNSNAAKRVVNFANIPMFIWRGR